MIFSILRRQSNILKNVRSSILLYNNPKRMIQRQIIFTNNINNNSINVKQPIQIKYFSLTQPRYSDDHYPGHWKHERYLAAAMLLMYPSVFIFPSAIMEYVVYTSTVVHYYYALNSMLLDYCRPIIFGNTIPKIAPYILLALFTLVYYGLVQFTRNDVGLVKAVKLFWELGRDGEETKEDTKEISCPECEPPGYQK